jgi:hypothetical protein
MDLDIVLVRISDGAMHHLAHRHHHWLDNRPIAVYEIWLLSRQRHCFSSHSCVPGYTIFIGEQSEMMLF